MKIAFVGKGGSGKTTLSALFSRYLAANGFPVIAIDADINQHLAMAVGLTQKEAETIPPLGLGISKIKDYLRGDNPRILSSDSMIKTTPPGRGSKLITFENNPIYSHFSKNIGGIRFMATGPFSEKDLGTRCYHSKVGAVELVLNHLIDKAMEYVIVDMTAGSDSFASGMFTKFDMTFLISEPTIKGLGVYKQYKDYAKNHEVIIKVIGNKVEGADDLHFLKEGTGNDLMGIFNKSEYVKRVERGGFEPLEKLEEQNTETLGMMKRVVDGLKKNWPKFYAQTVEFHIKNAKGWANDAIGEDLANQIDPDFTFKI